MKISRLITSCAIALALGTTTAAAGGPAQSLSKAAEHSVNTAAYSAGASVQAAAAVAALPLLAVGLAPAYSAELGEELWEFSDEPLPIASEPIAKNPDPNKTLFAD